MAKKLDDIIPEHIATLTPYPPGKPIEETERELGLSDVIKMASNENPLGPSPKAIEAIAASLANLNRYPDGSSYYLREALSKKLDVSPQQLFFGCGSNEVIEQLLKIFVQQGDKCAYCWPSFAVYPITTKAFGGISTMVPLKDMTFDLEALANAIDDSTRIVFITNPNNPTGTAIKKAEFEKFLDRVPPGVVIALDEAYIEYVDDPDIPNGMDYLGTRDELVLMRTFSKVYGLAGLRIGYAIGTEKMIHTLEKVRQPFNITIPAQAGALAALEDDEYLQKVLEVNAAGMKYIYGEFDRLGVKFWKSTANFILFETAIAGNELQDLMLKEGVIVRSMAAFGLVNHLRVTIGTEAENKRFVTALEGILAK
jgi:histidinol-phosphate aminotransferase